MRFITRIFSKCSRFLSSFRKLKTDSGIYPPVKSFNIWLDDIRNPSDGDDPWIICRSVNDAKFIIQSIEKLAGFRVGLIDLDHDMGDCASDGGDGIALMDWLLERNTLYPLRFHTQNPVGLANMIRMHRRYWLKESL